MVIVAGLLLFASLTILAATRFRWRWLRHILDESKSKWICLVAGGVCGVVGKAGPQLFGEAGRPETGLIDFFTLSAIIVFQLVDKVAETRRSRDREVDRLDHETLSTRLELFEREGFVRTTLLAEIERIAADKRERIADRLSASDSPKSIGRRVEHALDPETRTLSVLQHITSFLSGLLPRTPDSILQNFRVALYIENEGYMSPVASWDHQRRKKQFLESYIAHKDRFRLDCTTEPAYAVRCILEQRLLIVPDCEQAGAFLHAGQERYLRSLVAFPLCESKVIMEKVRGSLVIDTDVVDHFKEVDRATIETYLTQFARILEIEIVTRKMFDPQRST